METQSESNAELSSSGMVDVTDNDEKDKGGDVVGCSNIDNNADAVVVVLDADVSDPAVRRVDVELCKCQSLEEDEIVVQLVWRGKVRHGLKRHVATDMPLEDRRNKPAAQDKKSDESLWKPMTLNCLESKFSKAAMARSPFLAEMLQERMFRESFTSLDALFGAIGFLHQGEISGGDFDEFELMAAASLLQIESLVESIASVIARGLNIRTIVHSIEYGYKFGVLSLLRECMRWLKTFLETTNGRGTTKLHSHDYALDGRVVVHCLRKLPSDVFAPLVEQRRLQIAPYIRPKPVYQLCSLLRERLPGGSSIFRLYTNHDSSFLLSAIKLNGKYCVSIRSDVENMTNTDESIVGCMGGNLLCTQFTLFDDGPDPTLCPSQLFPVPCRKDIGVVMYGHNVLGNSPRSLTVIVPRPSASSSSAVMATADSAETVDSQTASYVTNAAKQQQTTNDHDTIASRCQRGDFQGLIILNNLTPQWNNKLQAYTMNFYDRVKLPSKKNFQLVVPSKEHEPATLLFGKNGKNEYALDFRAPLSAVQAIMIVLSHFDHRLGLT